MTGGRVSPARLPLAPLEIRDGNGNWQALTFVLDTGFTLDTGSPGLSPFPKAMSGSSC